VLDGHVRLKCPGREERVETKKVKKSIGTWDVGGEKKIGTGILQRDRSAGEDERRRGSGVATIFG